MGRAAGRWLKKFARKNDGSAAVEFALIAPAYFLMLFLVVELGRLSFTLAALTYAAEQATRYAIVNEPDFTGLTTAEKTAAIEAQKTTLAAIAKSSIPFLDLDTSNFNVQLSSDVREDGSETSLVTVSVTYLYIPWLPVQGASFNITTSSKGFIAF